MEETRRENEPPDNIVWTDNITIDKTTVVTIIIIKFEVKLIWKVESIILDATLV